MSMQGVLKESILKGASSIEVEPLGAYENFEATGGDGYITTDKFTYTGYSLGTDSFTLLGVIGVDFSHNKNEFISNSYGVKFRDIAPISIKNYKNDPDGLADAIMTILDEGMFKLLKDEIINVHKNIDPNRAELKFLKYICSNNGLEYNESMPEDLQRSLARQAANVLSLRGTKNAFRFMAYHLLGYDIDVEVTRAKVNARYNDRNFKYYIEPTTMGITDKTVSYWKFSEGLGATSSNEISGGNDFIIPSAFMWYSDSMFRKKSIQISNTQPYIESVGSTISLGNLHGKNSWRLRWFMKPATGWIANQIVLSKGTMLLVEMPSANEIKVTISDGITSINHTFSGITVDEWNYISLVFNRPTLSLIIDDEIIESVVTFNIDMVDDGSNWVFGDKLGVSEYLGLIDTFMIDVGETYLIESIKYFEHIAILRTYGTDIDRNNYYLDDAHNDGRVLVTVLNGDGDTGKIDTLNYLITEWLAISNFIVINVAHLPLENMLGLF